jgi:ABC-type glutathione transport system ATPase component
MKPLLSLRGVTKTFRLGRHERVEALVDVHLDLWPGECLGLVGESGSGKSTLGRLANGLLRPDSGQVIFEDNDLSTVSERDLRSVRRNIGMIFQEPYESLNPRMTIGQSVGEPLVIHRRELRASARASTVKAALEGVGLPADYYSRLPSTLSGGEQQRVGICRAIICEPSLLILDEPTSSLDVSIQADVLELLTQLRKGKNLTMLFISHDLQVVEAISDRIAVMQSGSIVETGETAGVMREPATDYTAQLLSASLTYEFQDSDHSRLPGLDG